VVRRRRMVRRFTDQAVPAELLDRVVDAGQRAPSAGFTQGWAFLVLTRPDAVSRFWTVTSRSSDEPDPGGRRSGMRTAPVIIIPLANKAAYLARYAEPDKAHLGLTDEGAWPVPYWDIDTGFATMAMLLAATDAGLGAVFFGLFHRLGERRLLTELGVPGSYRALGALALGWPAPDDHRSPSLARGRRDGREVVHFGRWGGVRATSDA